MLTDAARAYSELFSPEYFVLVCSLLLVGYEWRESTPRSVAGLGARVGAVGAGWAVAFAVYRGLPRALGTVPEWGPDATGSAGLGVGVAGIWLAWRLRGWGERVPAYAAVLVAATVPHLLVTPFWDVSSHVLYAVVPAGYLTVTDRRFAPLAAVALAMVAARPLAGAHTWAQSVGGLALGAACLVALRRYAPAESGSRAVDPRVD
jgi:hypothetical protein